MKVSFKTKEESNREQEEAFLRLPSIDRIHSFIDFMMYTQDFPKLGSVIEKSDNFQIVIASNNK